MHYGMANKKVLIIDDEEDLRGLLKSFLVPLNYDVFTAGNLSEGLSKADEIHPDIIFLDNNLPDGLGWSEVDTLQRSSPNCKINLISAFKISPEKIRDNKQVRLLEKPISFSMLRSCLE
jgi:two-component system, OmpR family, response regulator